MLEGQGKLWVYGWAGKRHHIDGISETGPAINLMSGSARQNNKKRKARNVINRERTVTTLTEGPESAFLIPTPTEEPPVVLMSGPFPLPSPVSPNMQTAFQMGAGDFSFGYNAPYIGTMGPPNYPPQHPTPPQFFHGPQPLPDSPMGDGDLEILENLKQKIKNGQHEIFKAVPNPTFLANLYMGPRKAPSGSQVPPHPEQLPDASKCNSPDVSQVLAELAPGRPSMDTSAGAEAVPVSQSAVVEARRMDKVPYIRVRLFVILICSLSAGYCNAVTRGSLSVGSIYGCKGPPSGARHE